MSLVIPPPPPKTMNPILRRFLMAVASGILLALPRVFPEYEQPIHAIVDPLLLLLGIVYPTPFGGKGNHSDAGV